MVLRLALAAISVVTLSSRQARGETGITADKVLIGANLPMTGAIKEYGIEMKKGLEAYWLRVNNSGGVHGRKIEHIIMDDAFDPQRAVANTTKLIERDKIFALVSPLGTPCLKATMPMVVKTGIPLIAPVSGATFLRQPPVKNIFAVRPSHEAEAEQIVDILVDRLKIKKIGIFRDHDALGVGGKSAVAKALAGRSMKLEGDGVYVRNTFDIDQAVKDLMDARPDAIVIWGSYGQAQKLAKTLKEKNYKPVLIAADNVVARSFFEELEKGNVTEMYFVSTVPLTSDTSFEIVKQYRADMKAAGHDVLDLFSLEGYVNAHIFHEALKKAGKVPTRDGLIKAMESFTNADFGGIKVAFGPGDRQGIDKGFVVQVKEGKLSPYKP